MAISNIFRIKSVYGWEASELFNTIQLWIQTFQASLNESCKCLLYLKLTFIFDKKHLTVKSVVDIFTRVKIQKG